MPSAHQGGRQGGSVNISEFPQGTEEWRQARCGWLGASSFSDVLSKGQGIVRKKCLRRIVAECLTGKPMETYSNAHMARGNEQEPFAREAYEAITGTLVEQTGFIRHSTLRCGFSPDGLIGDDGGVEIKSVIPTVQMDTIEGGKYPSEHKAQIQGSLWVSGRSWWDFCSFSPDMPEHLRCYIFRVERDEEYIKNLEAEIIVFLREAEALISKFMEAK